MTSATTSAPANAAGAVSDRAQRQSDDIEARLDYGFLSAETIDHYFKHAADSNAVGDPRFRVLDPARPWPGNQFPLALCEFLAYKSSLAYQEKGELLRNLGSESARGITNAEFFDSSEKNGDIQPQGDTQGFGFLLGDTAFIVMRGTTGGADWRTNVSAALTDDPALEPNLLELIGDAKPGRHLGYAKAWGVIRPHIEKWIAALPQSDRHPFVFSGHSLGGALAVVGAHEFASRCKRQVDAVVTFGAPMVGAKDFKDRYDALLAERTIQLQSPEDAVPGVLALKRYQHVGRLWRVDRRPLRPAWQMFFLGLFGEAWKRSVAAPTDAVQKTDMAAPQGITPAVGASPNEKSAGPAKPETDSGPRRELSWTFVLTAIAVVIVALLVRRALYTYAAHNMQRRYALYLSTLSYRRIRALRPNDFERANADLLQHLTYIRGADAAIFGKAANGPIRIGSAADEDRYKDYTNYFC